jgi:hypothetical protein
MAESLLDLAFSVSTLNSSKLIEKFPQTPKDTLAQDLFRSKGQSLEVVKDVARWQEVELSRKPAAFTGSRSPATVVEGVAGAFKSCVIADVRIASDPIPLSEITSERAAQNWIEKENVDKRKRMAIAREIFAWQCLKGSVSISNTTVPGSKVSFSWTQAVQALAPVTDWSQATTKIASAELEAYQAAYHDACGLEIERMLIDAKVHEYLKRNTEIQALYAPNTDKTRTPLTTNGRSFELEGIEFDVTRHKADIDGTLTKHLGDKRLIALPSDAALKNVLGHAEGFGSIPREAIGSDYGTMGGLAPSAGEYSYAYTIPDPAAVVLVFGWRGLFVLTFPEAVGYDDDVTTP